MLVAGGGLRYSALRKGLPLDDSISSRIHCRAQLSKSQTLRHTDEKNKGQQTKHVDKHKRMKETPMERESRARPSRTELQKRLKLQSTSQRQMSALFPSFFFLFFLFFFSKVATVCVRVAAAYSYDQIIIIIKNKKERRGKKNGRLATKRFSFISRYFLFFMVIIEEGRPQCAPSPPFFPIHLSTTNIRLMTSRSCRHGRCDCLYLHTHSVFALCLSVCVADGCVCVCVSTFR